MECANHPVTDLSAVAERLLIVLSSLASKFPERPIPSPRLVTLIFDREVYLPWSHETRRRRVREVAVVARELLARHQAGAAISGDGRGYLLSADPATIAHYAARRRRQGIKTLVAAKQAAATNDRIGQATLFPQTDRRY